MHAPARLAGGFSAVDAPGLDLLHIERPPYFAAALGALPLQPARFEGTVTRDTTATVAAAACAALDLLPVPGLKADIASLADRFLTELDRDAAHFRLEIVTETSCPRFHIDMVHVRLIATYLGEGTEYVEEHAPEQVRQLPTGAVGLFKGRKHPTHAGTVHHRSPATTAASPRLLLLLDY
jgi:hypothetical protein